METNEIIDIQLPDGLEQKLQSIEVDDNYLVIAYSTKEGIVIYRYNIGQQRWLEPITASNTEKVLNRHEQHDFTKWEIIRHDRSE